MKNSIYTGLKGAAMGIAEVIPGVSGGTIAFITGIYERLLNAIKAIHPGLIKIYREKGFKSVLEEMDALFLLKLFGGMAMGFVLGLFLITHLLEHYPIHIWSFFFGLILASIPLVARQIKQWRWKEILLTVLGTVSVYWISIAAPSQGSENLIMVFVAGVLGVSALMLPGLSGSFILLLLGMYTIIMPAVKNFLQEPFGPETPILMVFAAGMLFGLFSFARLLSWTFAKYRDQTLALMSGFLMGSLNKVWPWQNVLETRIDSKGQEKILYSQSILPGEFEQLGDNFLYGNEAYLTAAIFIMIIGALLVYVLDRFSPKTL